MSSSVAVLEGQIDPKSTGLAMAVHDLKGHLAVISGQAKLLRAGKLGAVTPLQTEALADIVSGCRQIQEQISVLLTGDKPVEWKPVYGNADLRQSLIHVHDSLQPEFSENGLRLEFEVSDFPMVFPFDANLVTRVLMNLLENARRFTSPGGCVRISLTPHFWERRIANLCPPFERRRGDERNSPNAARVVVADSGCGISPEYHQEIFEEYFSTPAPGCRASSGLGLAIARSIVVAHGGKIWVESTVGKGSSFCFLLPWVAPRPAPSAIRKTQVMDVEATHCED
jgi:signal transduction histidine kinase